MNNLAQPSSSTPSLEKRKNFNKRDRRAENYSRPEADSTKPRSTERDRDRDRDGGARKKRRSREKDREKPILNGLIDGSKGAYPLNKDVTNMSFEMGEDFVAFVDSSEDERTAPVREWDKGKGKARASDQGFQGDRDVGGKKRKHDAVGDQSDRPEQNREATYHRQAPWVAAVDWEGCQNVSEMCVSPHFRK
jgi:non-canonical poly(A) RNA polymerase PAPD5/7